MRGWMDNGATRAAAVIVGAFILIASVFSAAWFLPLGKVTYSDQTDVLPATASSTAPAEFVVTHMDTPRPMKGVYMTACTASEKRLRDRTLTVFEGTELNSLIIDLKDYTGTISYASTSVKVPGRGRGCVIPDLKEFIGELHDRSIYVVARITVFQDPLYASAHPEFAVRSKAHPEKVWRDRNGLAYIEVGAEPYWDYIVEISREAYDIGFDELNYDYIRFPSDGDMSDVLYNWSAGRERRQVLSAFFMYLRGKMADTMAVMSADIFGLTTIAADDLGIGQVLEDALSYFDYVAPMVYPSHFARGYNGIPNPAEHPYEVVNSSMLRAAERALAASTTPEKLRPWLQDFDLGAKYTPAMVRAQIQATYDAGLTSWMLWNAASKYQKGALELSSIPLAPENGM